MTVRSVVLYVFRAKTAKISGEVAIEGINGILKANMKPYAQVRQPNGINEAKPDSDTSTDQSFGKRTTCTLKLQGELTYSPEYKSEYKTHGAIERSQSIPQVNNIKFHGKFHGIPEYRDSFKTYNNYTKSAPIKNKDHLKVEPITVNKAIISPTISSSSEYTEKFKELNLNHIDNRKLSKQIDNITTKNNLMIGNYEQSVFPEYFDKFKNPNIKKMPDRAKAKSPILSMDGNMEYKPEYR